MFQEEERSVTAKHHAPMILVVEDDEDHRELFTQAFAQLTPYLVQVVRNGPEALHFVTQIKPNLFILDYRLSGMNGLQLYDQLHATPELEHIPAIIISSVSSEDVSHEIESRHLLHIDKPFDLDEFLDSIKMDTDSNAGRFVKLGRAAIKQVNGELLFSRGFGTVAPVVVLVLPENVRPESILPDTTWTEYTGA